MSPRQSRWSQAALVTALGAVCLWAHSDAVAPDRAWGRMSRLPARTLWVWERAEDLRAADPATTAIAWLDQTILIGQAVTSQPRHQPLSYPTSSVRIAVVRIEARPGARLDRAAVGQAAELLLHSARQQGIAALQVDFDATRSQRGFYTDLLAELRRRMPAGLPLSMTALASWCSNDDWIARLPVDEAVPMLFRMEPGRRQAAPDRPEFQVREPLCAGSVGISTHERWSEDLAGKRIYVFADRGWREDFTLLADRKLP